jgi:hypothetical protein
MTPMLPLVAFKWLKTLQTHRCQCSSLMSWHIHWYEIIMFIFQEILVHSIPPACAMVLGDHGHKGESSSAILCSKKEQGHLSWWWTSGLQMARLGLRSESGGVLTDSFFLVWTMVGSGQMIRDVLHYLIQTGCKTFWAASIFIHQVCN